MTDLTEAPSYRLAALDEDFILGDSMRGARFMMEYAKAEEHLRLKQIGSTLVVFGSARIRENGPEWQASSYQAARHFARIASERGGALVRRGGQHHNVIATGGGPGIMEAANRGACDAGALTIGFNISIPEEQWPNSYVTPDLCFRFHYFAMRKMHFAMRAGALIVFPGGFGTMDELFELLTLTQTQKASRIPIVLFDRAFWTRIINFDALAETGMISRSDLGLFRFADDAEEAWQQLIACGLKVS